MSRRRLWVVTLISACAIFLPASVLAQSNPRPTCQISVTPSVIVPGGTITLRWTSTHATAGAITNIGNVEPTGQRQVMPSLAQVTTYVGSFTGPGGTANCQASVQVNYGSSSGGGSGSGSGGSSGVDEPLNILPNSPTTVGGGGADRAPTGLVQCGRGGNPLNCQACELARLIQNIINFLIGLSIPIAAMLFAWAGVLYFTSGASPGNIERAKGIFSNALIGFLIAITSWIVVNTLLHALLDGGQLFRGGASWFVVRCDDNNRPTNLNFNQVISGILAPVGSYTPSVGGGGTATCDPGWTLTSGICMNDAGDVRNPTYTNPTGGGGTSGRPRCDGAGFYYDAEADSCYNPITDEMKEPAYSATQVGGTCTGDCVALGIPNNSSSCVKAGGTSSCLIEAETNDRIVSMCQEYGGCTGTAAIGGAHNATCQKAGYSDSGTCIDMVDSCGATAACIQARVTAAQNNGLRAVFETKDTALYNSLRASAPNLVNSGNILFVGHATGNHYSIYKQ